MEFNRGMAGVLVVVLSLIASIVFGVITNVDDQEVERESVDYLADITGAFKTDKEQSYIEYNPASNYNGYTNLTTQVGFPVELTTTEKPDGTEVVNNYPINYTGEISTLHNQDPVNLDVANEFKGEYSGSDAYRLNIRTTATTYVLVSNTSGNISFPHAYVSSEDYGNDNHKLRLMRLDRVIEEYEQDADPGLSELTFTFTQTLQQRDITDWLGNIKPVYYFDNNIFIIPSDEIYHYTSVLTASPSHTLDKDHVGESLVWECVCYLDPSGDNVVLKMNNTVVYSGLADGLYLCASETPDATLRATGTHSGDYPPITITNLGSTCNMDVTLKYDTIKRYMDTRYGVGIRNGETVEWANGENIGLVDIVFHSPTAENDYSTTGVLNYSTSGTDTFTISRNSGMMSITLNGISTNIGTWEDILVRLDAQHKTVTVIPISTFTNFNTYTLSSIPTVLEKPDPTSPTGKTDKVLNGQGDITKIVWTANNSFKLQIDRTMVFLNSYGVVMIDPEITIANLWPVYDKFMVYVSEVATIGDSITFGSNTYSVNNYIIEIPQTRLDPETQEIIHYNAAIDITDMQLFYTKVTDDNNQVSWTLKIDSKQDSATITVSDTYLKFTGTWYFKTGFYEIVNKIVHERTWNPNWLGSESLTQVLFFMLLAEIIGSIIMYKLGYLGGLDILILIGAGIILVVLVGGSQ